jgi:hypothetical protein
MKICKKNKFLIYLEAVQNNYIYEDKWNKDKQRVKNDEDIIIKGQFNKDLYLKILKAREL